MNGRFYWRRNQDLQDMKNMEEIFLISTPKLLEEKVRLQLELQRQMDQLHNRMEHVRLEIEDISADLVAPDYACFDKEDYVLQDAP
tara:strand:+ start:64 stop:321 length:258 start_codon:yes stop_codon:yes gene_type:complete